MVASDTKSSAALGFGFELKTQMSNLGPSWPFYFHIFYLNSYL